jgi:hypothetical protein
MGGGGTSPEHVGVRHALLLYTVTHVEHCRSQDQHVVSSDTAAAGRSRAHQANLSCTACIRAPCTQLRLLVDATCYCSSPIV